MRKAIETWFDKYPFWAQDITLIAFIILVNVMIRITINQMRKRFRRISEYSLFKSFITHLSKPLKHFVPILTMAAALPFFELQPSWLKIVSKVFDILLIISVSNLLIHTIKLLEDFVYHTYDLNKPDNIKERKIRTQLEFIRKIAVGVIMIVGISAILLSFDNVRKIGAGLLTGVGVGGIIIGFAAQKSLANFLAGFQIAFTQPIRIDDILVVEGEWGKVEEITLTYVVLKIWDQRSLIVPINYFLEKPFQNWTKTSSEIQGTVFIYTDYTLSVDELRTALARLLSISPLWDGRVGLLQVTDAKEQSMEIRVLMSALNSSDLFDLRCTIREKLIGYISKHGVDNFPKTRVSVLEK